MIATFLIKTNGLKNIFKTKQKKAICQLPFRLLELVLKIECVVLLCVFLLLFSPAGAVLVLKKHVSVEWHLLQARCAHESAGLLLLPP